jgi:long-chain acyl-CoA synthetase
VVCITSGSAPITSETMNFLKIAFFDSEVIEGFGLTETCAFGTRTWYDDPTATGTIGGVAMANELKLVDVAELGYTAGDHPNPRGEVRIVSLDDVGIMTSLTISQLCFRGTNVFSRYYKGKGILWMYDES